MVDMGIDFGSTYTTISVYRHSTGMVETLTMSSSPYIPTTVALMGSKYEFGRAARSVTGKRDVRIFKGFKMLLPELDSGLLEARGYDEIHSPRRVAARFLEFCLRQALQCLHESKIHRLVVGVPEIWNQRLHTLDARTVLLNILREFDFVEDAQVISEPAAATAFFSHNFKLSTGREYDGSILLIDYGGGTLDLTLTEVSAEADAVQIKVLERTGAGENEDGKIGKAGIVYMETVMAQAIRQSGLFGDDLPAMDGRFYKAVDNLEEELQFRTGQIKDTFDEYGIDYPEDLEMEFTSIDYRGEYIPVTYRLLVEVYDSVVRPVLKAELDHMIDYMERNAIRYMDRNQDIFKIALVGGFGNYYLVRKQIEDTFQFSTMDKRQEHIIRNQFDREKSISMGAAMLAADVVSIRHTAPFSIGFTGQDPDGVGRTDYAIAYKQDIEYGEAYFPLDGQTGKPLRYLMTDGTLSALAMDFGDTGGRLYRLREEYRRRLTAVAPAGSLMALGFSMDASGELTLHLRQYGLDSATPAETGQKIQLAKCVELFEPEEVEHEL
ncbi:MAG: hypothetical protein E7466_00905 [Ruminococcaceae bacterium]|nr:hypothetical protein [Oscillospiraceae bacterium]